ncbi:MAG: ShlB/FhaC/HecB family hemolysin secretion/activation protein [Caulobacteraceae bacterium]|nr:ShlB/FhaC/HecB family hemolysin secretion/activation protein [Caulobacteraceae bacterium]
MTKRAIKTAAAMAPLLLAATAFPNLALAQTPGPSPAEVLRFESPQRAIVLQAAPAVCPKPAAAAAGPVLSEVTFEGATRLTVTDFSAGFSPLIGRPADAATADQLAAYVDCRYAQSGYVAARAEVVRLTDGGWRVRVREGVVSDIEVTGADAAGQAFIRRTFSDVRSGRPLNVLDLRRGVDAAARFGFWGVSPSTRAASGGEGVVLVLAVAPGPPSLFLSAQNASADTVGTWSGGASLIFDGLTPLREHTIIGLFHDLTGDAQRGAQISSQALLSNSGLEVRGDLAVFEQKPDERPPNLDTEGLTRLARLELRHPLGLHSTSAGDLLVAGRLGLESVNQDTELTTGPATARDRLRVVYAGVQADYRSDADSAWGFLSLRKGLDGLGASTEGDALLSRIQADPAATVLRFEGQASFRRGSLLIQPRLRAQKADRPLLQYEEFTYGGLIGGRALDPGALYGDSGVSGSIDLYGPAAGLGPRLSIRPAAFVEGAWASNEDTIGPDESHGLFAGAGIRLTLDGRWTLDILYATPIRPP